MKTLNMAMLSVVVCLGLVVDAMGDQASGAFARTGDDTTVRFFHNASVLDDGQVMVTGGMRVNFIPPTLVSLDSVSFYDADSGMFVDSFAPTGGGGMTMPVLNTARSSHTQTTMADGRVLVTGGNIGASATNPGSATNTVELFDPATGVFTVASAMNEARAFHTATGLSDGRVLVAGGGSWQVFDPGMDNWSRAMTLIHSRTRHAAVVLGGAAERVLLIGGSGSGAATLEIIDPDTGSTLSMQSLMIGVCDLAAAGLPNGDVLIVGGQNASTGDTTNLVYRYEPPNDNLEALPVLPDRAGGISDHELVSFGRYIGVFGGEQQVGGTDTELDYTAIFDAGTNTWPHSGVMTYIHDDFAAVGLDDDRAVLIGGGVPFLGQVAASDLVEIMTLEACPADVNCSGVVNIDDLLDVVNAFGDCPVDALCPADTNATGLVNIDDLLAVVIGFGACD